MDENLGMEAASQAALYRGNMKLVYNGKPYGDATWRMYNLATDPGETNDLAETEAELFADMMKSYEAYKEEFGVLEMPKDYEAVGEITNKLIRNLKKKAIPWLIGFVVALTGFIVWRRRRRKAKS